MLFERMYMNFETLNMNWAIPNILEVLKIEQSIRTIVYIKSAVHAKT